MVVCHCNDVGDREIRAQVSAGARTVDEITDRCGAGGNCGGCVPVIEGIIAETAVQIVGAAA